MKREMKKEVFPWQKVLIIAAAVVFVVMFIFNYLMTAGTIQYLRTVRANDSVTIDFTLLDMNGQPVLTTDQNLYRSGIAAGRPVFLTEPLTVRAGYVGNPPVNGLDAQNYYLSPGQQVKFGLLGQEMDELDIAVIGMKKGETKTTGFTFADPLSITLKDYEFTAMGGNFSQSRVGDLVPLGLSETPIIEGGPNSTAENPAWRIGTIVNKTADSVEVRHRYPTADITVEQIG
jgi:hypothetical protein